MAIQCGHQAAPLLAFSSLVRLCGAWSTGVDDSMRLGTGEMVLVGSLWVRGQGHPEYSRPGTWEGVRVSVRVQTCPNTCLATNSQEA